MISVDNLLIRAFALNTVGVYGLFLVSSNCLLLLILFYWFYFSIVCPKGREGQTAIMKYEWDASLTFGLLSTWKHLIYVISKKSLETPQGVEGREEGQFTLWLGNSAAKHTGVEPVLTQQDLALNSRCWNFSEYKCNIRKLAEILNIRLISKDSDSADEGRFQQPAF